ncbi:MAG: aminomethyl-transferring glycine dehydrogenase subunit GcvPA [Chloroflexi bacterium]|nr:aminomethyl-transferring glycine dehydrogenase subunit GcvPA [Chloroflexota bacterium]
MPSRKIVYPYIPNSEPAIRAAMLKEVGATSVDEFYADIPPALRFEGRMNLPAPFLSEAALRYHVEGLLRKNTTAQQNLNFLGAGCYQHHVPAVCDEINSRGEFLTAYAGEPYDDHGRFQALFEYCSMMAELLEMDVVNVPTYDGFQAAATSLRMACRITARTRVLLAATLGRDQLSKIRDYLKPEIEIAFVEHQPQTGGMNLEHLVKLLTPDVAAIYFENPSYLGFLETRGQEIADLAHKHGALTVVSVDPISLGVLEPPVNYGADIVCGDIQPLGMHMQFGGGQAGFIASRDEEKFVMQYPSRLFGIAPTRVPGEYSFGDVAYERTSFAKREEGNEWVGTAAALWGITAGVYLALMGPQGMKEIGETILYHSHYALQELAIIKGVRTDLFAAPHFKEFVVNFDGTGKKVVDINKALLEKDIFGGKDLSREFPWLGESALYCFTEIHTKEDIDRLVAALKEVLA